MGFSRVGLVLATFESLNTHVVKLSQEVVLVVVS